MPRLDHPESMGGSMRAYRDACRRVDEYNARKGEGGMIHLFALEIADPSIKWPDPSDVETALKERPGWNLRRIWTTSAGAPVEIEAMCRDQLAVNLMLPPDKGFAITHLRTGARISYGGSVFARCHDAMAAAEAMMAACDDWDCVSRGFSEAQRGALRTIIEAAERRGEIMLTRVYPY